MVRLELSDRVKGAMRKAVVVGVVGASTYCFSGSQQAQENTIGVGDSWDGQVYKAYVTRGVLLDIDSDGHADAAFIFYDVNKNDLNEYGAIYLPYHDMATILGVDKDEDGKPEYFLVDEDDDGIFDRKEEREKDLYNSSHKEV